MIPRWAASIPTLQQDVPSTGRHIPLTKAFCADLKVAGAWYCRQRPDLPVAEVVRRAGSRESRLRQRQGSPGFKFCFRMPTVQFNIRLDGKPEGCVSVPMEDNQSLREARGLIVAQAAEQLGQQVLLRHFLVTVRGRTGYLEPQWEDCSITELMPITYSQVGLDLTVRTDSPRSTRSGEWPRIFAITV